MKKIITCLMMILLVQGTLAFAESNGAKDNNMTRTEFSNKIYNELFNEQNCLLKETDNEFYETAKKFIYGDVAQTGSLTLKERELITIVVLTVNQQPQILKKHIEGALNTGLTPVEIKEAIYQTAPYAGIPKAVIAVETANEVFKKHKIKLPLENKKTVNEETRYEKGLEAQVKIFGEGMKNAKLRYPKDQQHIPQFLAEYCFGDFYTNPVIDLKTRELLTLCMLTALGDTESQIKGHIQGNLNMGNTKETMIAAITQCLPYIGFPRTLNALRYLEETASK